MHDDKPLDSNSRAAKINSHPTNDLRRISHGLEPHPQLCKIIYHLTVIAISMWPLEPFLGFNHLSLAVWFHLSLGDMALSFHSVYIFLILYI